MWTSEAAIGRTGEGRSGDAEKGNVVKKRSGDREIGRSGKVEMVRCLPVSPRPRVSPSSYPRFTPSPLLRFSSSPHLRFAVAAMCLLVTFGCRRDMQDQPKMKPLRSSTFFRDRLSARPLIEGTVPRGWLRADTEFYTGKKATAQKSQSQTSAVQTPAGPLPTAGTSGGTGASTAQTYPNDVDVFPFQVTDETLKRGKERYEIFCSVCHGLTGYGDGIVVRRGFRRAASFHDDRLRQAPVGHFFDAVTNGWGAMPSYATQIPVPDRWNIVAYIRALQLSQENQQTKSQQPPAGGRQQK